MATAPLSNLTALWNSAGTAFNALKMNVTDTASAAGSLLIDLQVGGVSQFKVSKTGNTSIGLSSFGTFYNKTLALGGGASSSIKFTTTNTGTDNSDGTDIGVLNGSTSDFFIVQRETANILIEVNGAERARISPDGNVGIGTSSFGSSSQKVLAIGNAAAVPTGNPTDGGVLYVESGALKYRGSSGTVTTIANA